MSIAKNILTVVSDPASGRATLALALRAARFLDAHVDALHVRPDPVSALPLVGEAMSGAMVDEMLAITEREAGARAKRAKALYDELIAGNGVNGTPAPGPGVFSASWIEDTGIEEQVATLRACRADFLVLPRPTRDNEPTVLTMLNTALMQGGRPVLTAPPASVSSKEPFARVAVFWNGSTEATRAVAGALPFLVGADEVTILSVEEEEWSATTEDLEVYLTRHGVKSIASKVIQKQGKTGQTLLTGAVQANADLLVMGAYTRSKVQQLILGSVTGYVLAHATMPVLLCH